MQAVHALQMPRLSMRIAAEKRDLLERAAALETGGDLTKFVLRSAEERAERVLEQHEVTIMDAETRTRIYEILNDPAPPSEALVRLFKEPSPNFRVVD